MTVLPVPIPFISHNRSRSHHYRPFRPTTWLTVCLVVVGIVLWLRSDLEETHIVDSSWHSSLTSKLPNLRPPTWPFSTSTEHAEEGGSEWNVDPTYLDDDPYAKTRTGGFAHWLGGWGKTKPAMTDNQGAGGGTGKGRRVLVTGGGGSIGQDLVRKLLQEQYRVTIIDSQNMTSRQMLHLIHPEAHTLATTSRQRTLSTDISPVSWYSSSKHDTAALTFYQGDIRDDEFVSTVVSGKLSKTGKTKGAKHHTYSGIFHLAAVSRESWCKEREKACHDVNVGGTQNIVSAIEMMAAGGEPAPWMIVTSALEVYGDAATASAPKTPSTALGRTKLAMEGQLQQHSLSLPSPVLVLRPSLVYGAEQDIPDRLLPSIVRNALSDLPIQVVDGKQRFDMLYIQDLIQAFMDAIEFLQERSTSQPLEEEPVTQVDVDIVDGVVDGVVDVVVDGVVDGPDVAAEKLEARQLATRAPGTPNTFYELDVLSGFSATIADVAAMVMSLSLSSSPIETFDTGSPLVNMGRFQGSENDILKTKPSVNIVAGVTQYIDWMRVSFLQYASDYLAAQCPNSKFGDPSRVFEADRRNQHLERLRNCTVEVGVKNDGFLNYVKCGGGSAIKGEGTYSDECLTNVERVASMKWNASIFLIREVESGLNAASQIPFQFYFEEERTGKRLGFEMPADQEEFDLRLYTDKDAKDSQINTLFEPVVQSDASNLQLRIPGTPYRLKAVAKSEHTRYSLVAAEADTEFDVRFTMICCPTTEPWPLLMDDYETADIRFGTTGNIPFNSSSRLHTCGRVEQAVQRTEGLRIDFAQQDSHQKVLNLVTSTRPRDWRLKDLPPCWNDCNNPLICVQTGACRCVQADDCKQSRLDPLAPVAKREGNDKLIHISTNHDFVRKVERISWLDLLLPSARRIIQAFPELIKVHVVSGYEREEEVEAAECHKLQDVHCFSADSIMYRAMRHISVPADEADLIILPVYQHCEGAEFLLHDVMLHASDTIPDLPNRHISLVLTHDWGICIQFAWDIWGARHNHRLYPDWILDNVMVWSVMGDWISPCYRPHQDVVIPARTCLTEKLKNNFKDMYIIKPASKRPALLAWAGTYWGTGKNSRLRLTCPRGGVGNEELVPNGGRQSRWLNWDYMNDLNNAIFCPQPTGIAGWSTRPNDAIYAGCIPVLMADGSHYPYADIIDWSKISVRISPTDLDHIEDILRAIPMEQIEQMQANLLAIREAFLYSSDETPEDEITRKGPLYFALQSARIRLSTAYPTGVLTDSAPGL